MDDETKKILDRMKKLSRQGKAEEAIQEGQDELERLDRQLEKIFQENDKKNQKDLDRLKKMDNQNKARVKKYLDKAKAQGKKQVSALISGEAYDIICRERDKAAQAGVRTTLSQIISQAILDNHKANVKSDVKPNISKPVRSNVNINVKSDSINWDEWHQLVKESGTGNIPREAMHRLVLWLSDAYPDKRQAQDRVTVLKDAGILFKDEPLTVTQFKNQRLAAIKAAQKRAK